MRGKLLFADVWVKNAFDTSYVPVAIPYPGFAPSGFVGETSGQQPDFWLPLRMQPIVLPGRDRLHDTPPQKSMWLHVFGRLKPGVTSAQAEAQANAVFRSGLESFYGAIASGDRRRDRIAGAAPSGPGGRLGAGRRARVGSTPASWSAPCSLLEDSWSSTRCAATSSWPADSPT